MSILSVCSPFLILLHIFKWLIIIIITLKQEMFPMDCKFSNAPIYLHNNLNQVTGFFARHNFTLEYWSPSSAWWPMQESGLSHKLTSITLIKIYLLPTIFQVSSLHQVYGLPLLLTPSFSSHAVTWALNLLSVLHVVWSAQLHPFLLECILQEFSNLWHLLLIPKHYSYSFTHTPFTHTPLLILILIRYSYSIILLSVVKLTHVFFQGA